MTAFQKRDDLLIEMGYLSYQEYLKSELWEYVKSQLERQENVDKCWACLSKTGLVWHHTTYSLHVLVGNIKQRSVLPEVVRVCCQCHRAIHFVGEMFIEDMSIVNERLLAIHECFLANGCKRVGLYSMMEELIEKCGDPKSYDEFQLPGGF